MQVQMVNDRAATVYVGRKVSVKQYESLEVGAHLPVELPERTPEDSDMSYTLALNVALREGINLVKVQIYDALGLEYTDNNGVIAEKIAAKIEGSKVAPAPLRSVPNADDRAVGYNDRPPAAPAAEGETACPKCKGAMWDNRVGKTNPKQPDFKCKDKANCDGIIWPPRGK